VLKIEFVQSILDLDCPLVLNLNFLTRFYGFKKIGAKQINCHNTFVEPVISHQQPASGQIKHHYKEVDLTILSIAGKAVTGLTSTQAIGDLYRIYTITQRDGIDYNLGSVPADYVSTAKEAFDPDDLKRLYDLGYKITISGYPWAKYPP